MCRPACLQRSSIGAVGVRLCTSAQLRMPYEIWNSNLPDFAQGPGQPQTAAWLCFKLKYACQAPIAANAAVVCRQTTVQREFDLVLLISGWNIFRQKFRLFQYLSSILLVSRRNKA